MRGVMRSVDYEVLSVEVLFGIQNSTYNAGSNKVLRVKECHNYNVP